MKLTKSQLERRKKKRMRFKPLRRVWRVYLQQLVREYNRATRQ